jgi:periplasmic copper chaperone A
MTRSESRPLPGARPRTVAAAVLGAAALTVLLPGTAHAHVGMTADTTAAGSYAVLTLAVPHGCEGSPTTQISIRVPASITTVTPTVNPGWTVRKVEKALAAPVSLEDGDQSTNRVVEVVWRARQPLPDGFRDTLSLQVLLPADAAGQELAFPTVQTCAGGETAWTQMPATGQDDDALEHPAPSVVVTAAEPDGHHRHDPAASTRQEISAAELPGVAATPGGTSEGRTGVAGLVLGALGLIAGTASLLSGRRSAARDDRL